MYNVSNDYLTALATRARFEHARGTIGTAAFTDANIIGMSYNNRCTDTSDINFGSAYIGQLEATFINVNITRGDWRGLVITLEAGLTLADDTIEYTPVGVFTISSAEWTDTGVHIIANDNMIKLDKTITENQISGGTIYSLANYFCTRCGVTFGLSEAQCQNLPNGSEMFGLYPDAGYKTYRDLMSWLAQAAAGFVTADRSGNIIIKSFADLAEVYTLTASSRIIGSVFSDYTTKYAGISILNIEENTTTYYEGEGDGTGAVINLGGNPFLQYGLSTTKDRQRQRIADIAAAMVYTPFQATILSTMAFDLGDVIENTGGNAGATALTCCVNCITWTLKQQTVLQGFGADPALATGQSRGDKNLSGLISKTQADQLTYYAFTNVQEITLPEDTETTVINIEFASKKDTPVDIWHELNINAILHDGEQLPVYGPTPEPTPEDPEPEPPIIGYYDGPQPPAQAIIRYYYDGNLLDDYTPTETWNEQGLHIIGTNYYLPLVDYTTTHTWRVTVEMVNGSGTVAIDNSHALLKGQGMVATDAGARKDITVEDITGNYDITAITPADIADDQVTVDIVTALPFIITESMTELPDIGAPAPHDIGGESLSVIIQKALINIITEDGNYNIVTGDNKNLTTEGE